MQAKNVQIRIILLSEKKLVCKKNVKSFKLLKGQISNCMIKKPITSNISYETLKEIYKKKEKKL